MFKKVRGLFKKNSRAVWFNVATLNLFVSRANVRQFLLDIEATGAPTLVCLQEGWDKFSQPDTEYVKKQLLPGWLMAHGEGPLASLVILWKPEQFEFLRDKTTKVHDGEGGVTPVRGFFDIIFRHVMQAAPFALIDVHPISKMRYPERQDRWYAYKRRLWVRTKFLRWNPNSWFKRMPVIVAGDTNYDKWNPWTGLKDLIFPGRIKYDRISYTPHPRLVARRIQVWGNYGSDHNAEVATFQLFDR